MSDKLYPCLWFDNCAKEASLFYGQVFGNFSLDYENQFMVNFRMHGQTFMAMNGGPQFRPNPSISFFVLFETASEVEMAWNKLIKGGKILMPLDTYDWSQKYGWLQDSYGVNWQLALGKFEDVGQKFAPCLMFTEEQAGKAEKAIHFYTSVFKNSSIKGILHYDKNNGDREDFVKHAQFNLGSQVFMAMDSSLEHGFAFSEGVSLVIECQDQAEIDYFWKHLTDGGTEVQCGWLKDRFGVSWQVIPAILKDLMSQPDKSEKVVQAFLKMKKFEIQKLLDA